MDGQALAIRQTVDRADLADMAVRPGYESHLATSAESFCSSGTAYRRMTVHFRDRRPAVFGGAAVTAGGWREAQGTDTAAV